MAMTGGTAYLVKSEKTNYGSNSWTTDLYIYVKVISQNVIANCSTIALGMFPTLTYGYLSSVLQGCLVWNKALKTEPKPRHPVIIP